MSRVPLAILSLMLMAIPFSFSYAQVDVKISKKAIMAEKDGFREAWDNISKGDECYRLGGGKYREAATFYQAALIYSPLSPELNYKAGISCLFGDMPDRAINYLLTAFNEKPDVAPDILLMTGRAYQSGGEFSLAIDYYNRYGEKLADSGEEDKRVSRFISECKLAIEMVADPVPFELVNLGVAINSEADDYAPSLTKDKSLLYFTSRRNSGETGTVNSSDMKYDENIYVSNITERGWDLAGVAGENLATAMNEGILSINNSNDTMFVYAGWAGNGDIYLSEFSKGEWSNPVPLPGEVNSEARETSLCITGNGNELFFTSDRKKGGNGGRDIWYARRVKKNRWTKPYNLGSEINSSGNEESVWVSDGGDTLWFSSNAQEGIGGYDVFVTYRDSLGIWSPPVNLGIPVNSPWDDIFFRPVSGDRKRAYISSNRPGGIGGYDIYEINFNSTDSTAIVSPGENIVPVKDTILFADPGRTMMRDQGHPVLYKDKH